LIVNFQYIKPQKNFFVAIPLGFLDTLFFNGCVTRAGEVMAHRWQLWRLWKG